MTNDDLKRFYQINSTPEQNKDFVRYDAAGRIQVADAKSQNDAVNLKQLQEQAGSSTELTYKGKWIVNDEIFKNDIVYIDKNTNRLFYVAKNDISNSTISPDQDETNWREFLEVPLADIDTSKFVTTDTKQTITGVKTFDSNIEITNNNNVYLGHNLTISNDDTDAPNFNTCIGQSAKVYGRENVAIGYDAGVGNTRSQNSYCVSIGSAAGRNASRAHFSTNIGAEAGSVYPQAGSFSTSVGYKATGSGVSSVAIGESAKANANTSIQIGTGTNNDEKTLQIYDYQLLDGNTGKIPAERIPDALTNGQIKTVSYDNTTLADHITEILGHVNIENGGTLLKIGFKLGSASVVANATKATIASGANPTVASVSVAAFKASGFYSFTASDIMTEAGVTTLTLNGPNGLDGTSSSNIEITSNADNTTQTCAANGTSTAINAEGNVEITSFKAVNLLSIPLEHLIIDYFTI